MYAHQNNILSIPAKLLYQDWGLMSEANYYKKCTRGKLVRTKEGKGADNQAWVSYYDLPIEIQQRCIKTFGDPEKVVVRNILENYILPDTNAINFYARHSKPNGRPLSEEKQREKATNAIILNAIKLVFEDRGVTAKMFGKKKTLIWQNVSNAVNNLNQKKWHYKLPGNHRKLKQRYQDYLQYGYGLLIHKGEGATNASRINKNNGDFLLAQYCLPIKLTIPEVLERYELERVKKGWPTLSNGSVYNFLYQPERERIWTLARHGKETYSKKYKHTLTREKSNWFPNCYWAIDGTKLDWIHFWDDASNKMGAKLKIDVMFDVYSEKIIGWALSFTESHVEHFKAIKMAVNEAQCRPYFLTYDNQGGHKMNRMKTLYNSLVAVNGGTHHPNKAKEHSNPAEGLFNRLQKQVINKFWYSDGQSITVKRDDNKVNIDYILKNKSALKTVEDLYAAWETAVVIWNNKKHPHFEQTRNEVYQHEMLRKENLSIYEIMDKMWIDQKKRPIQYKSHGLDFRLGDKKHQFEVYDADGNIDLEFRRKNVGKKFIIRYDPDFLDGYIQLCTKDENDNIIHIANAEPKRKIQEVPILMNEGDKEQWAKDYKVRETEYNRDLADLEALLNRTGITPEQEMEDQDLLVKFKGNLNKVQRSKIEAQENLTSAASRL